MASTSSPEPSAAAASGGARRRRACRARRSVRRSTARRKPEPHGPPSRSATAVSALNSPASSGPSVYRSPDSHVVPGNAGDLAGERVAERLEAIGAQRHPGGHRVPRTSRAARVVRPTTGIEARRARAAPAPTAPEPFSQPSPAGAKGDHGGAAALFNARGHEGPITPWCQPSVLQAPRPAGNSPRARRGSDSNLLERLAPACAPRWSRRSDVDAASRAAMPRAAVKVSFEPALHAERHVSSDPVRIGGAGRPEAEVLRERAVESSRPCHLEQACRPGVQRLRADRRSPLRHQHAVVEVERQRPSPTVPRAPRGRAGPRIRAPPPPAARRARAAGG